MWGEGRATRTFVWAACSCSPSARISAASRSAASPFPAMSCLVACCARSLAATCCARAVLELSEHLRHLMVTHADAELEGCISTIHPSSDVRSQLRQHRHCLVQQAVAAVKAVERRWRVPRMVQQAVAAVEAVERRWRVPRMVQQAVAAVEAVERRWRVPRMVQQAVEAVEAVERRRRVPRMVQRAEAQQARSPPEDGKAAAPMRRIGRRRLLCARRRCRGRLTRQHPRATVAARAGRRVAPLHKHQLLQLAGGVSSTEERARVERVVRGRGGVLHRAVLAVGRRLAQEELSK
jgi:uncharacterized protein YerC